MTSITIITRHYPPNKGINGILANEMAKYLINNNVNCNIVCIKGDSEGNREYADPVGNIIEIKPINNKSTKIKKIISLVFEGRMMLKKAKLLHADLTICTSSPPLLPFWASLMLKKHNWAFWSLDLFPEGFVASNIINKRNIVYKILNKITYKNAPNYLIALGKEQAQFIKKKYKKKIKTFILPAGVLLSNKQPLPSEIKPFWSTPKKITLGYLGNIGLAHNPQFIKDTIDLISTMENMQFLICIYGVYANEIKMYSKNKTNIIIQEKSLPLEHLAYIDIHLISLRLSWTHLAVPSKAVTAISCGRPVLFCGNEKSDNWQMFKEAGWFINEKEPLKPQINDFLSKIDKDEIKMKSNKTNEIYINLKKQVLDTYKKISELT